MASKQTLLHTIKVNRRMRKSKQYNYNQLTHPALLNDWDSLTRDEQSYRLYRWKIKIKQK
jgi:hypothetical protein